MFKLGENCFRLETSKGLIHITVFSDNTLRICYGEIPDYNITDAVISGYKESTCKQINNELLLKDFKVTVNEQQLVKIVSYNGEVILEDTRIKYNCKAEDYDYQEQMYEVINRDKDRIYAYEISRAIHNEEGYYGLGEKYGFINYKGRNTENWNTDVLGVSPIHTSAQKAYHTSIPFYLGVSPKAAYGVFHDTSFRNYFDFGKYHKAVTVRVEGGTPDYYFIYGPKVRDVVSGYTALTGRAELPRKDFLGYQQCRWSYMSSEEVLKVAKTFREKDIPIDVMYLDIDYMQDYKVFTWNSERFKDFKSMLKELKKLHIKLVVIIDPGIKKEKGYHAYEQGILNDCFIKDEMGEVYIGRVWPGESAFPDFLQKRVRDWWGELHKELIRDGVEGLWNDMNEIADMSTETKTVPETTYHLLDDKTIVYQKEAHNIYGHYHAKASYEAMRKNEPNKRPFILTRAASAGTQRYSALWTGDNTSIWEHLEMSMPMLLNLGLSGFAFVGSDIGGFVGDGEGELLERWMQLGMFYPLCRNHSCMNSLMQEPWAFGSETETIVTKFIKMRYTFITYLYNLFWEHNQTGAPILRPLFFHYQNDIKTYNVNDEFMFGDSILVVPIYRPMTYERLVYLPEGTWYDLYTDEIYTGGRSYIIQAERDKIPVFIKAGSIIIRDKVSQYVGENDNVIELHYYKGEDQTKLIYFDDGLSYQYKNGEYAMVEVSAIANNVNIKQIEGNYKIPEFESVIHG